VGFGIGECVPHENRLLWDLLQADDFAQAREVYQWYTPLLHLDTHVKLVQYIKLAVAECGYGSELTRAPRLPLEGAERDQILNIIRQGIEARPALSVS
jgi:dihydrodipicolinate synthase/N-acetylneuraminate lyase